jgi:hypothetical protein
LASPKLQWSAAEVTGGALTVPVEGDRPNGWKDKFENVVTLLGGGPWGEVVCRSGNVRVTEVAAGGEESLHHFLEAVVQETNAAFATDDEPGEAHDDDDAAGPEDGEADDADARQTEAFRNLAG